MKLFTHRSRNAFADRRRSRVHLFLVAERRKAVQHSSTRKMEHALSPRVKQFRRLYSALHSMRTIAQGVSKFISDAFARSLVSRTARTGCDNGESLLRQRLALLAVLHPLVEFLYLQRHLEETVLVVDVPRGGAQDILRACPGF